MCGDSNSYDRIDICILVIDRLYCRSLSNDVSFGVDDRYVLSVRHQVIEEANGNLVK